MNARMLEVARHQLQEAKRHARPEKPSEIDTAHPDTRHLFVRQNRECNRALQAFWHGQIERYS